MEWNEIDGDLIKMAKEGKFDLIAHGSNCKKNMGAGIALVVKQKFPKAYDVDKNSPSPFGGISICTDYKECVIINAYTQKYPGKAIYNGDSETHRYEAIRKSMKLINEQFKGKHIGLPLIGCGLAGLTWNKVKKILKEELVNLNVTIVHYKN